MINTLQFFLKVMLSGMGETLVAQDQTRPHEKGDTVIVFYQLNIFHAKRHVFRTRHVHMQNMKDKSGNLARAMDLYTVGKIVLFF